MTQDILSLLVPPGVAPSSAFALLCLSFFTSALTGALGLGGGVMMLAAMTQLLPPAVLLPVHGVVQIGSNLGRSVLMRRDIARALVLPFLLGSAAGVALGAQVVDLGEERQMFFGGGHVCFLLRPCRGIAWPCRSATAALGRRCRVGRNRPGGRFLHESDLQIAISSP